MRALTSIAALAAVAGTAAASAAPAQSQMIAVNGKCFVNARPRVGVPITVTGSGFPGGDGIGLATTGVTGSAIVSQTGTFITKLRAPTLSSTFPASERFTLTALDTNNGRTRATTSFSVANLAFRTTPTVAKPSARVRFSFSGFRAQAPLYGHYLFRGRVIATKRFGRTAGSCGLLRATARLFPITHPKVGRYAVQFDDSRSYRPASLPRITSRITIARG